ncbi:ISHa1152 transposase B fragment 3 [Helicobacter acinonychis str. Sheeba]|uniref:ISHa1152 transposase B 3 n=1 Tax=Helicobacter acinonychis (strain Sheeba) TaxID=382638 RepID=Q17VW9_HELAH|nr:ISHa1152 transposase B fragment 3 [Helicobacter acinonychis str. Sheeba]CAK00207.1 ISHa1152 transposase B fragment 3 [Helicobacter acinonychis str. Sheeba]
MQDLTERADKAYKKFFKKQAKLPRFKKVAKKI